MTQAQHLAATPDWGSPPEIVELARTVMGGIDCDPCSSAYWNEHVIRASSFVDEHGHVSVVDPSAELVAPLTRFVNPPGGMVKEFWLSEVDHWQAGADVFWVGFSLNQMTYLGGMGLFAPQLVRCAPFRRLRYLESPLGAAARCESAAAKAKTIDAMDRLLAEAAEWRARRADPPHPGDAPPHGSYLAFMPSSAERREKFVELAAKLGAVF